MKKKTFGIGKDVSKEFNFSLVLVKELVKKINNMENNEDKKGRQKA